VGVFRVSTERGTVEGDVGESREVERGGVGGRCVDAVRKSGLEERMARGAEGITRIRSIRGRSIISSGSTSSSSSISGRGGVGSISRIDGSIGGSGKGSSSGNSVGCSMISTSITNGGVGGSGSASGGSRVSRDVGSGGEETGRRKVIGDGNGNRVCTIGLLLTG